MPPVQRRPRRHVALERALSKLGLASRSQARALILDDKVSVNGRTAGKPLAPVDLDRDRIDIEGVAFDALGHDVTRLKRIAFGPIELGSLAPGQWREIPRDAARTAFPGATMLETQSYRAERMRA